jgi:arylsulfatase A-like enzyme
VRHGFARGFDVYRENKSANIMDPEGQADVTFGQAREWLAAHRDRRFFLFLHTFQVHTPYAPPPRYADLFGEGSGDGGDVPSHRRWMDEYDREIRYTDDELRRLFETIDALGLGGDSVFILTSDHGEAFLEHGLLEHGARLDEEVLRVPLLFWGRGVPAGRRIAAPVAHVDLLPTILELLGLEAPASADGLSLLPLLEGRGGEEALRGRALFSEARGTVALGPERSLRRFLAPAFGVRVGDRKLARYRSDDGGFRYEYYDVAADPGERHDLYESRAAEAADLRALVDGYEARSLAQRRRLGRGEPAPPERVFLDPRQEEKLRALGYLE